MSEEDENENENPVLTLGTDAAPAAETEAEVLIDPTGRMVEPTRDFHWGTGGRKNAVARGRVKLGTGEFQVNGKALKEYFTRGGDQEACLGPLRTLKVRKKLDVMVSTHGGGVTGQSGAVRMGLGRALLELYPDSRPPLREDGHLSRDPRMVERKHYGYRKARRGQQWGKR